MMPGNGLDIASILNSYASIPKGPDYGAEAEQAFASIPTVHGVDLSSFGPLHPYTDPAGFMKSSSAGTLSALSHAQNGGGGGIGGFLHDLWQRITGPFEGAWAGMLADAPKQNFVPGHPGSYQPSGTGEIPLIGGIKGFLHGLVDSGWAHQAYEQEKQKQMNMLANQAKITGASPGATRFNQWLLGTALDTMSNPVTYAPLGWIGKVTGITPALRFTWDWMRGAVKNPAQQILSTAAAEATRSAKPATNPFQTIVAGHLPAGNIAGLLPEVTQTAQEAAQRAAQEAANAAINEWAGLAGGYVPKLAQVEIPAMRFAGNAKQFTHYDPNQILKQLREAASKTNLPAGREYEYLQNLLSSISGRTGRSLEQIIQDVNRIKPLNEIVSNVKARNAALRAAGLEGYLRDIMPKNIRPGNAILAPGTRTVLRAVQEEPNFTLQFPLVPRETGSSLIPISEARTNVETPFGIAAHEAAAATSEPAAQAETRAITQAAQAASKSKFPYAVYNWQHAIGAPIAEALTRLAPNGIPGVTPALNRVIDELGKRFVKFYGATPALAEALRQHEATGASDQNLIINAMSQLAREHNLSDQQWRAVIDELEGTAHSADPAVQRAASVLRDVLNNGIETPFGRMFGVQRELNTYFKGKPILSPEDLRQNYYPHRYNNTPKEIEQAMLRAGMGGFSTKGPFTKERQFNTVREAIAAGLNPELNPLVAVGQRLHESSRAIRNAELLNNLIDSGIVRSEWEPGLVESSIPQLRGMFLRPEDDAALRSVLEPRPEPGSIMKAYDKALQGWKTVSVFNPLVHTHNILYNGVWLGGARPWNVYKTFQNLRKGVQDEWFQRALRAGAISADRGRFVDILRSSIKNASNQVRDKLAYALHGALWDLDKAIRTELFRQAVENGASDQEAAAIANKFMIDYNNLTPFEERFMTRIFPFYRWMKGNLPLQVEQWINNTPKQVLYEVIKNAVNQAITGENMGPDGKIDTGIVLSDGSHVMIDPYAPADEPLKLVREGLGNFLWGKVNPIIREAILQATNKAYYPSETFAPQGKPGMSDTQIAPRGTPNETAARIAHLLKNINPLSGSAIGTAVDAQGLIDRLFGTPAKQAPGPTPTEILTRLLGGFPSRDNPVLDKYYQQKERQKELQNILAYDKKNGIPIPPALKKAAYAKIPFPGGQ